jgi:outer membrane protein
MNRFRSFICTLAFLIAACDKTLSIRYVDNGRLFADAKAFVAVRDSVQSFNKIWQNEAKGLKDSVDAYMKNLSAVKGPVSDAEKQKLGKEFEERQNRFQRFAEANKKKSLELEKGLTESVVKKVNAVLQKYRDEKGYSLILGTTVGGNILAAEKDLDITEDVIKSVNAAYP